MKFAVWLIFYLSLLGMLLATVMRSTKVRDLIADAWFALSTRLESPPQNAAPKLFVYLVSAFYLRADGRISWRKVLMVSLVVALIVTSVGIEKGVETQQIGDWGLATKLFFVGLLMTMPMAVTMEVLQANVLRWISKRNSERSIGYLWTDIFYFYCALLIASSLLRALLSDVPRWLALVLIPLSLPGLLAQAVTDPQQFHGASPALLPTLITYTGGVILILLAHWISTTRQALVATRFLAEKLSTSDCNLILTGSMFLFTLSTGVMQAYGF